LIAGIYAHFIALPEQSNENEQTEYELITNLLSEGDVLCKHTEADGPQSFMMEILYCNGSMYGKKRQSDNTQEPLIAM